MYLNILVVLDINNQEQQDDQNDPEEEKGGIDVVDNDNNTDNSNKSDSDVDNTKDIAENEAPLGAKEDNCFIHWIILILSILVAGYTIARVAILRTSNENSESKQDA